ncbi:hypothetical protein [Herbaspirillum robiniae]|uniref:hypothetical protein n=1 Tax=Herbaspirillum robiniae TaxID=2014887 RepID=UPI00131493E9|nr:hypothetical protein [Herbaspirillum robiniae]
MIFILGVLQGWKLNHACGDDAQALRTGGKAHFSMPLASLQGAQAEQFGNPPGAFLPAGKPVVAGTFRPAQHAGKVSCASSLGVENQFIGIPIPKVRHFHFSYLVANFSVSRL